MDTIQKLRIYMEEKKVDSFFIALYESSIFDDLLNENSPHKGGHADRTTLS